VQQSRVVEMNFFGGLTIAEIADALNVFDGNSRAKMV
jgi:DNA-directed RNA polymerase specialized sigma24 family protein